MQGYSASDAIQHMERVRLHADLTSQSWDPQGKPRVVMSEWLTMMAPHLATLGKDLGIWRKDCHEYELMQYERAQDWIRERVRGRLHVLGEDLRRAKKPRSSLWPNDGSRPEGQPCAAAGVNLTPRGAAAAAKNTPDTCRRASTASASSN